MALSAQVEKCPVMMIPSMHSDLPEDPVTTELVSEVEQLGIKVHLEEQEGKRKPPR